MKRFLLILLILICSLSFAYSEEGKYSLAIKNSDTVRVKGSFIQLSGNVNLDFTSESGEKYVLTAQKVTIDTDNKTLDASGSVILTQTGDNQSFKGELVTLDWEHLDVKVFDGKSVSERTGSSNQKVNFHSQGETISYAGEGNTVLFKNGIVSTKAGNTNWSINAKEMSLLGSDLFFKNATLRIGRVPIFWFPVFYYPSSRLAFNPSVGISDKEKLFINTTTEIFGTYSMSGSSGSVQESDTDALAGAVLSLLSEDDNTEMIRDGLLYRKYDPQEKLGKVESWARRTGSYMIFTADAYEEKGFSFGYETRQLYKNSKIQINSKGISGINPGSVYPLFRFASETTVSANVKNFNFSLNVPFYTDNTVKKQYSNRNQAFSFDSIFGTKQKFPTTYSSTISNYTMSFSGSYSKTIGRFTFSLSSLRANVTFVQDKEKKYVLGANEQAGTNTTIGKDENETSTTYGYKISSMSLPTLSFSSSGTILDLNGESTSSKVDRNYTTFLARRFAKKNSKIEQGSESVPENSIAAPSVNLVKFVTNSAPKLKISYNLSYNLDNYYNGDDFDKNTLSNKLSGSVTTYAKGAGDWFNFTDVISPSYNFSRAENKNTEQTVNISNSFSANIPKLGLSYSLANKIYSNTISYNYKSDLTEETPYYGKFDSKSISTNQLTFSKSIKAFSFGVTTVFRPLTEAITPSLSFSKSGFSASSNFSLKRGLEEEKFTKNAATLNLSYSSKYFSAYLNNTYDLTLYNNDREYDWDGYSSVARAAINVSKWNFSCYSLLNLQDKFEPTSMESGFTFRNSNATLTFSGDDYKLEAQKLNFNIKYNLSPHYFWKNRIGIESSMNANLNYNFKNPYATAFTLTFNLGFSISKFLDLNLSMVSGNSSFYNYYENNKFSLKLLGKDILNSLGLDLFNTNFNLSSISLSIVHYMEDWNLYFEETGKIDTSSGTASFEPQGKVYIKWNVIPEIKTENTFTHTLDSNSGSTYRWDNK